MFYLNYYFTFYLEFEGEAVCFDLFDTLTSEITTKVAIGIYDNDNWEIIKKVIDDVLPNSESINIRSDKSEKGDSKQPDQSDQTILLNNTQMKTVVPRLDYRNTERRVEYVETANQKSTKLACKVIFFEISLNMFVKQEKPEDMYHSIRLNLKNEAIKLMTSHSYFLFSDLVLTSMSSIAASTDRFISLFKTPEFDPVKLKTSVRLRCYYLFCFIFYEKFLKNKFNLVYSINPSELLFVNIKIQVNQINQLFIISKIVKNKIY